MAEPALIHQPQELLEGPAGTPMSYWNLVWWRLRQDQVTLMAAAIILCIVLSAVLAPYLAPHNPAQGSIRKRLAPVGTPGYMLGTDEQGRDMLSRLLYGGRLSLTAGVVPVCMALLAGATLGILAGFMGRWVNMLIMRTMDIFYAFPSVLLAIAISGALGPALGTRSSRCPLCLRHPSRVWQKASPHRYGAGSLWRQRERVGLALS